MADQPSLASRSQPVSEGSGTAAQQEAVLARLIQDAQQPSLSLEQLLDVILESLTRLLRADAALVLLRDEQSGDYFSIARRGLPASVLVAPGGPVSAAAWAAASPGTNELPPGLVAVLSASGFPALLGVPLSAGRNALGLLVLAARTRGRFAGYDESQLGTIVSVLSLVLERRRVEESARHHDAQDTFLSELTAVTTADGPLPQVLRGIATLFCQTFGYYAVSIGLVDGDVCRMWTARRESSGRISTPSEWRVALQAETLGQAYQAGETRLTANLPSYAGTLDADILPETASRLLVPLRDKENVLGVLDVRCRQPYALQRRDRQVAEFVAGQVTLLVENERLRSEQRRHEATANALARIPRELSNLPSPVAVLEAVADLGSKYLQVSFTTILAFHAEAARLELDYTNYPYADGRQILDQLRIAVEELPAWERLRQGGILGFDTAAELTPPLQTLARHLHVASLILAPIIGHNGLSALVVYCYATPHHATREELAIASTIAFEAAAVLDGILTHIETGRVRRQLEAVRGIALSLGSRVDQQEVMAGLLEQLRKSCAARYAGLILLGGDGTVEHFLEQGYEVVDRATLLNLLKPAGALHAVYSGETVRLAADAGPTTGLYAIQSLMGIPVSIQEQFLGAILLVNRVGDDHFSAADEWFASLVALHVAAHVNNARRLENAQRSLLRQDMLYRELHHRIKNNLQAIAGFLSFQAARGSQKSLQHIISATEARIKAMAALHEVLSLKRAGEVNLNDLLHSAIDTSRAYVSGESSVTIHYFGTNLRVPSEKGILLALVVSELVYNALEHGQPQRGVWVHLRVTNHTLVYVSIANDGLDLPETFDLDRHSGLGLTMARRFVEDELDGRFLMQRRVRGGTRVMLTFPFTNLLSDSTVAAFTSEGSS